MARNMYGATSADFTLTSGGRVIPGAVLTLWSARTGGTQITDLLDVDSVACTTVTSAADGSVVYYGPDTDLSVHWADSGQGSRVAIRPVDITGEPPTLTVGTVDSGTAAVAITGDSPDYTIDFTLPVNLIAAQAVDVWGHSYLDPSGSGPGVTSANNISRVLSELLGLPVRNNAIGGAHVHEGVNAGGGAVGDVLQKLTRPGRWTGTQGLYVTMWGINDLNKLGNTADAMRAYFAAYRAAISRMRQGRIFENTDASVTYGGVYWEVISTTSYNSGASVRYGNGNGGTIAITTPADFPGGTLVLGVLSWSDAGATLTGTVNGVEYSINTKAWPTADKNVPGVLRIPNVPAGAATYTFTTSNTTAPGMVFDYWAWEAPEDECPLVVIVKAPLPLDWDPYGSVSPGPPTDAGVAIMNAGLDALAAEFGERVITVDTSDIDEDADYWSANDVHPNAAGHAYIARQIFDAVKQFVSVRAFRADMPREDYGTAAPTGTSTRYLVGDRVINSAPAEAGSTSSKYVTVGWVCTVAGTPGTWVPLRCLTGN